MRPEEIEGLGKRLRRGPLHVVDGEATPVSFAREAIEQLLPHRSPFLLVDHIDAVSIARRTIRGALSLRADDPVFGGHFPGDPVYPGVLQVEAIGQLGLCLLHFLATGQATVAREARPRAARITRINHAAFLAPVVPGWPVEIHAGLVDEGGLTSTAAGQLFQRSTLCSTCVLEVYLVED